MRPEFFPISYWLADCDVWIKSGGSYVHIMFALANENNV